MTSKYEVQRQLITTYDIHHVFSLISADADPLLMCRKKEHRRVVLEQHSLL